MMMRKLECWNAKWKMCRNVGRFLVVVSALPLWRKQRRRMLLLLDGWVVLAMAAWV
jgi:hypothetical protein